MQQIQKEQIVITHLFCSCNRSKNCVWHNYILISRHPRIYSGLKLHVKKKKERFTGLFLLQFLIAWLNCSCTCFMLLVTGTDQKQKKVSCSQRAVVTSDGAVVLTCLSVPLLLLSQPETQDSQCSGAFSQKRQHPSWWHCHMDSQVTCMESPLQVSSIKGKPFTGLYKCKRCDCTH